MTRPPRRFQFVWLLVAALAFASLQSRAQAQAQKHVLMINELGPSHPGPVLVTNRVLSALYADPRFQLEFYAENLDAVDTSDEALDEARSWIMQKYHRTHLDLIVLVGPEPFRLMTGPPALFPGVPIVFCCSAPSQLVNLNVNPQSTGSWILAEPAKTLDVALRLLPATRQVFVVAGQSKYDRAIIAAVKPGLASYEARLSISYLDSLPMAELKEKLKQLPSHSIVLFTSFFKDAKGQQFISAAEALPMIVAASNAPVFSLSDSYVGRGIVGGYVVSFDEQGKIAAHDSAEILAGKSPQEIPVVYGPSLYQFDWRQLKRWKLDESKLPPGSIILFREPGLWERYKWALIAGFLAIAILALLIIYLLFKQKQLKDARAAQEELSRLLIYDREAERKRLSGEIHDEFSQRLAALALNMATTAQTVQKSPQEANRRLQDLSDETCRIAEGLYTLSHRLYSATLETLGPAPAVRSFCTDFSTQSGIEIQCTVDSIPRSSVHPDIALCIFRIVQECLRNMQKHSCASSGQVSLQLMNDTLHLSVCDRGVGFDSRELKERQGLGIRSMDERVRVFDGRFEIRSKVGMGTTVEVWLPAQAESASVLADTAI